MSSPSVRADRPDRIGRYRVLERIGKGAMGTVYAAADDQLGRRVAIKLMLGAFGDDPELRERFFREARITGQLAHRNIVITYDIGEEDGRPFIVMELLDGLPLTEYLRTDACASLDARIDLMIQVCDGLQAAHAAGVVHRDVKPSNLLVLRDGTLKVLDFGVARLAASTLTARGAVVGTLDFMSPEQALGQPVAAQGDIFAAASVFYFMLAGRAPFASTRLEDVIRGITREPPPPLSDDVAPEALWRILARALEKSPAARYRQCADMRGDLDRVRRSLAGATARIVEAARERYRQILALIEERRALGRSLSLADVETSCDESRARIEPRFRAFAAGENPERPMDRAVASAALEGLQLRYNAERAALAALREQAADAPGSSGAADHARGQGGAFWREFLKRRD